MKSLIRYGLAGLIFLRLELRSIVAWERKSSCLMIKLCCE